MNANLEKVKAVFLEAVETQDPGEWAAYLDAACGTDLELRHNVELLLEAHASGESLLDKGAIAPDPTIDQPGEIPETPGTVIGPYKLLEQIGEGGFGVVFMAEQEQPMRRKVALKVIKPGMDTREVIARFEAERQALAMMDHPNIARVLDAGATDSGRPYFAMELVKGVPITDYCDRYNLEPRERLELFATVCAAVQHAHTKGVIHRDIKPSNVLITLHDGRPVPKVIDFGVSKAINQRLTERTLFTQFAQMIGTPLYMSPEQAELSGLDVDTRSDIYSLGVLLYELLTGTTPFEKRRLQAAALDEIRRIIREEEPPRPSLRLSSLGDTLPGIAAQRHIEPKKLGQLLRGELDWIVMKALEKDRTRRYETANALAVDVLRYLTDEPVQACPPSAAYRFKKFARRNKAALVTVAVVAVALLLGIAGTTWQAIRATAERNRAVTAEALAQDRLVTETEARRDAESQRQQAEAARKDAEEQRTQAESARKEAETQRENAVKNQQTAIKNEQHAKEQELLAHRRFYAAQINLAQQAWNNQNFARTLDLLETLRPKFDEDDPRTAEWYLLWQLCHPAQQYAVAPSLDRTRPAPAGAPLQSLIYSPDGRILVSAGWDETIRLWDAETGRLLRRLDGHSDTVVGLAFSPDGGTLASTSFDDTIILWDVVTGTEKRRLQDSWYSWWLAFSPDGNRLLAGQARAVRVWDVDRGELAATLPWPSGAVLGVAFSPDGKTIAAAGWTDAKAPFQLRLYDAATQAERATLRVDQMTVFFAEDNSLVCVQHGAFRRYEPVTGKLLSSVNMRLGLGVQCWSLSPDSQFVAWGGQDRNVRIMDLKTQRIDTLHAHLSPVQSVTFSPDGKYVASAGDDGRIQVSRVSPPVGQAEILHTPLFRLRFSADGKLLLTATANETKVWDVATKQERAKFNLGTEGRGFQQVALSPDGRILAGVDEQTVRLVDCPTGADLARLPVKLIAIDAVAFSPDGKTLAAAGRQDPGSPGLRVILWDVSSKTERASLDHGHRCSAVAFSPDGRLLATAGHEELVKLWDAHTKAQVTILNAERLGHQRWLWGAAFSPDSRLLATVGNFGSVKLWDVTRGRLHASLVGHEGTVYTAYFLPDGKTLMTSGTDGARFWDPVTGQERMALFDVQVAAVSTDGRTFAFAHAGGVIHIHNIADDPAARRVRLELDPTRADDPVAVANGANQLLLTGKIHEAIDAYTLALERLKQLKYHDPQVGEYSSWIAQCYFALSLAHRLEGNDALADSAFAQGVAVRRELQARSGTTDTLRVGSGSFFNGEAWRPATPRETPARHARLAVALAKQAVLLDPKNSSYWNTLGVSYYRAGDWQAAIDALEQSVKLKKGGEVSDWLFLAMAHWQLGQKDVAREEYNRAVEWVETHGVRVRFWQEAAELLGAKVPAVASKPAEQPAEDRNQRSEVRDHQAGQPKRLAPVPAPKPTTDH